MRTGAQRRVQGFAYGLADHVIANSEAVRKKLIDQGINPTKVSVVYNGLDVTRLASTASRPEILSLLGLPPETSGVRKSFVTIVANMRHEVKDYPMFLNAARLVKQSVPEAAFLLAGEGELTDQLRLLARELGIEEETFFLGRCEQIGALLQVSDVCVLTSKAEGFSNAILEYMAAARPVVATDVGGAREAVAEGQTGYLVSSGDYQTMAERIMSLLRDRERAQLMGERGQRVVEEKFSCEAQLADTEKLYERLLTTRQRH